MDRDEAVNSVVTEILECFPDAVVALDRELRVAYLNERARELVALVGVDASEAVGRAVGEALSQLLSPEFRDALERNPHQVAPGRWEHSLADAGLRLEWRLQPMPSGLLLTGRCLADAPAPLPAVEARNPDRETPREECELLRDQLSAANVELTRREEALREAGAVLIASEARYQALAAATSSIVWITDPRGAFVTPQASWEAYTGQSWEEHRGFGWAQAIHPEDRDRVMTTWEEAVRRSATCRNEGRLWHAASGTYRFFIARAEPIRDAAGAVREWIGTISDIDESKRAVMALHESEERFRQLTESIREVFWLGTPDKSEILYVSPAYEAIWGRTCDSLYQAPVSFTETIHPEDRERVRAQLREQNHGSPTDVTYRIVRPDGSLRWIRDRSFPLRNAEGQLFRVAGIAEDITAEHQAQEARREFEALARQIFESSLDCIHVLDLEGRLVSISASGLRALEVERAEDVLGKYWQDFWPEDREQAQQAVEAARRGERGSLIGFRPKSSDAHQWWDVVLSPILDEEGRPERLLAISRDITLSRKREAELLEQSRIIEAVNRISEVLAGELDLQKLLQALTDAATQVCGAQVGSFFYNVQDDCGDAYLLYSLSGMPREAFADFPIPRNTAIFGPTFRGEGVVRLDDVTQDERYGKSAPFYGIPPGHPPVRSYLAVPVISRSGKVLGGLFFGHAEPGVFTERHQRILTGIAAQAAIAIDNAELYKQAKDAEYAARRHADELREANERKDEFISMLSHELRNPLGVISNAVAAITRQECPNGPPDRRLQMIERQTRNLVRMVDDLLDASRLIHGLIELKRERIALNPLLERVVDNCRELMERRGHHFSVDLSVPPIVIDADPTRLEQILWNLLDNAAKYTEPGGSVWLMAGLQETEGQPWVVLRVRDSGIGMSPDLLTRAFDLFAQADRTLDRAQGGLGIGLTVVRRLIQLHGGTIEAHSEGVGRGSEFVVRLPVLAVNAAPAEEQPPVQAINLPRLRILVVDDLIDAAETLQDLLAGWGQDVRIAHAGAAALDLMESFQPQVVLLDLGLPGWDGFEVARRIRETAGERSPYLIAVTGYGQDSDLRRTREAGFLAHLTKPVDLARLQTLLAEIGRREA